MGTTKRINLVTLEQAKSTDVMRGFAFAASALAALLLGLYDDTRWPTTYPGLAETHGTTATPLRGHVVSGLMVEPDQAGYLTVTPGRLLAVVSPANGDDAALQVIDDPGVQDTGALTFTANATADVRLDIVEVSVVDSTIETATVGVFNPTTKVFDPTPSPKVKAPRLSYRVRTGTAGSGLPALASGWMPIAVVNVQPSAAGFSTCDVWDVRPLVADRVFDNEPVLQPDGSTSRAVRSRVRGVASLSGSQAGAEVGLRGYIEGAFGGYRAGGEIRMSAATNAAGFGGLDYDKNFLLNDTQSHATVYTPVANQPYFFAVVFPGGLPRWVRYSQDPDAVAGKRVPRGPRGILLRTTQQPSVSGYYSGLTPAATSGFTASAPGIMLLAGMCNAAASTLPFSLRENVTTHPVTTAVLGGQTGGGTSAVVWTFSTANSPYPANATELILDLDISADAAEVVRITVEHKAGSVVYDSTVRTVNGGAGSVVHRIRIPLWQGEADGADAGSTILKVTASAAALTIAAKIAGWATA